MHRRREGGSGRRIRKYPRLPKEAMTDRRPHTIRQFFSTSRHQGQKPVLRSPWTSNGTTHLMARRGSGQYRILSDGTGKDVNRTRWPTRNAQNAPEQETKRSFRNEPKGPALHSADPDVGFGWCWCLRGRTLWFWPAALFSETSAEVISPNYILFALHTAWKDGEVHHTADPKPDRNLTVVDPTRYEYSVLFLCQNVIVFSAHCGRNGILNCFLPGCVPIRGNLATAGFLSQ